MKPHEMRLHVEGCGNPKHGPFASCWKVIDAHGSRVIQGVPKDVADFYAAAPDMARALVELLARIEREGPADVVDPLYDAGREALQKAGVL